MSSSKSTAASMDTLPSEALSHVLGCLPLQQRIQVRTVSKAWAAAATAAMQEVSRNFTAQTPAGRAKHLLRWLAQHGQHTTALRLAGPHANSAIILPYCRALPQLRFLEVFGFTFPAPQPATAQPSAPTAAAAAAAAGSRQHLDHLLLACRHLTRLHLVSCRLLPSHPQPLTLLTRLPDLQHLQLVEVHLTGMVPASIWASLSKLTHLDLSCQDGLAPDSIHALTSLTRLQTLLLGPRPSPGVAEALSSVRHLSHSLDRLEVWCNLSTTLDLPNPVGMAFAGTTAEQQPFLTALTGLTSLALGDFSSLDASLLTSLTALQSLQLHLASHGCTLGTATLLPALAQCTRLTALRLAGVYSGVEYRWAAALAARLPAAAQISGYAALTRSPVLQRLELTGCVIPQGAWAYIFGGGGSNQRQLPRLVHVNISNITGVMRDDELQQMVCCCPGLTSLTLRDGLPHNITLDPLLHLTGLRELCLDVCVLLCYGPGACVDVLERLTGLHSLKLGGEAWAGPDLLRLTALKHLTNLTVIQENPPRLIPDVWEQLLHHVAPATTLQQGCAHSQ